MNEAAVATNTTIQFCMMQPSDLLSSLMWDAATNGRASMDYEGGCMPPTHNEGGCMPPTHAYKALNNKDFYIKH